MSTLGPQIHRGSPGAGKEVKPLAEEEKSLSLLQVGWKRLRRHRIAMVALWLLVAMHMGAVFADFLAPYGETRSNRIKFFHPPTKIHFFDEDGRFSRPFVYNHRLADPGRRLYVEEPGQGKFYINLFHRGEAYNFLGFQSNVRLFGVDGPAVIYLLGADSRGRDILSRVFYGARKSLFIALPAIAITISIGLLYGGISGYYGGWVDNLMMRMAEVVIAVPAFFLLIALAASLRGVEPTHRFFFIVLILSFIGWAGTARVIRGMVLSIRQREFVEGARAVGCNNLRVIARHILPNTLSYVIVVATLAIPSFILLEAALSFIGLGIQQPQASWGNMLSEGTNLSSLTQYPWILTPGIFIFIAVLCWNFVGDGVRDAFDPRSMRR